ncbi:hypothetical protein HELRODRAFT_178884 [Helobdella robusta]|uniref:Uncharacterized protein n=1 Tax=Helobdella robusta TaxID=6412 RepID=T1FDU9_HELRO|nr:hypothetical protein HELRODRAFT_178884 [Helobdella robusta]ESN95966.1 hypothetical protein HELRODRAFT_178884 [Helobdella robusta]
MKRAMRTITLSKAQSHSQPLFATHDKQSDFRSNEYISRDKIHRQTIDCQTNSAVLHSVRLDFNDNNNDNNKDNIKATVTPVKILTIVVLFSINCRQQCHWCFLDNPTLLLLVTSLVLTRIGNSFYCGFSHSTLYPLSKAFGRRPYFGFSHFTLYPLSKAFGRRPYFGFSHFTLYPLSKAFGRRPYFGFSHFTLYPLSKAFGRRPYFGFSHFTLYPLSKAFGRRPYFVEYCRILPNCWH